MDNLQPRKALASHSTAKPTVYQQFHAWGFSSMASPALPTHHGGQSWFLFLEDATMKEKVMAQWEVLHHGEAGAMYIAGSECRSSGMVSQQLGS